MSLLRPTCTAVARSLCRPQTQLQHASKSPILSLLHKYQASRPPCRAFNSSQRSLAKVSDPPNASVPQVPKRQVRIGYLPNGRVSDAAIFNIFGRGVSGHDGNNVLRILHHRRTAGSLADYGVDNLGKQFTHITRKQAVKALEWLREKYPIDEARAAEEWAEKEANRIQYELWLADPETESKYKDPARAFKEQMEKEEQARQQQEAEENKIGILHAGKSQFERNIEQKRMARLEEATRKAEAKEAEEREMERKLATGEWVRTPTGTQLMKPGQETYVDVFGREQVSRRKEEHEKYSKLSESGFSSEEEMLSKTTLAQRLYPMTAFVLVTTLLCWGFSHYYLPPSPSYRLFPDLSPTFTTVGALFTINAVVAICWRVMPLWPIMTRYFMHVPGYPRAVQSVLNVFSHIQYEHFLANMMYLVTIGPVCCDLVGRGTFVGTYIASGAIGTLASLYWANLGRGSLSAHSVGASAAIWGIAALFLLLTDQETLKIPLIKDTEVAFWPKMLFGAFVALEFLSMRGGGVGKKLKPDHASHIGGMVVGIVVAMYLRLIGFHDTKTENVEQDTMQERAGTDKKVVDLGSMAMEGMKEVKGTFSKESK